MPLEDELDVVEDVEVRLVLDVRSSAVVVSSSVVD
jgi:hypothetical protein